MYSEMQSAQLGRPTPRLSWFMESTLLDESWLPRPASVGGGSINRLLLPGIGRQHQHARLVCQAANTDLVQASTTAIILDIQCNCYINTYVCMYKYDSVYV